MSGRSVSTVSAFARQLTEREFNKRLAFLCNPLLCIAKRRVGIDAAEDLLQDMKVRAWQIRDRFDAESDNSVLFGWLSGILHDQIRMYLRRQGRHPEVTLPPEAIFALCDTPDSSDLVGDQWLSERAELRRRVTAAVLTPQQRFCVEAWLDGVSLREIGESFDPGLSKTAVWKTIQRVGKILRGLDSEEDDRGVLECIKNLPTAIVYHSPKGVWDRRGTSAQVQARRYRIQYGVYRDGALVDVGVDVVKYRSLKEAACP